MLLKITTAVVVIIGGWTCFFGWYLLSRFCYTRFFHYAAVLLPFVIVPFAMPHTSFDGYSWDKVGWYVVAALSYLPAIIMFSGLSERDKKWDMPIINLTQIFVFGFIAHFCIKKTLPQVLLVSAGAVGSILFAYLIRCLFGLKRG